MVPAALALPEVLSIELLLDDVPDVPDVEDELLGLVLELELELLGLVLLELSYELPLEDPIIALLSVQAPLAPCRHPVRVTVPAFELLFWSHVEPDVPVVLLVPLVVPDWPLVLFGSVVLPDCVPLVEPDWAARVTAKAHAIARLDAVVTTRFMS